MYVYGYIYVFTHILHLQRKTPQVYSRSLVFPCSEVWTGGPWWSSSLCHSTSPALSLSPLHLWKDPAQSSASASTKFHALSWHPVFGKYKFLSLLWTWLPLAHRQGPTLHVASSKKPSMQCMPIQIWVKYFSPALLGCSIKLNVYGVVCVLHRVVGAKDKGPCLVHCTYKGHYK